MPLIKQIKLNWRVHQSVRMVYLPTLLSYPPTSISPALPHPHPCPLAMVYARAVPSPTRAPLRQMGPQALPNQDPLRGVLRL